MLEKTFQPAEIEPRIANEWNRADAFKAGRVGAGTAGNREPFCVVIPPPNVTGSLHMGHALNNTLQDVYVRFERMRGKDVLWQPGTDHAGIATQMVVERQLAADKQPGRRELGREKFLEKVWSWKAESGGTIVNQLKRLGCSCDWSRERFTMDEGLSTAVVKVFVELHARGLIYKDKRLVNWDPKFQTAISDLEVDQQEKRGSISWVSPEASGDNDGDPEKPFDAEALRKALARDPSGHMYHFRYPLSSDPAQFVVVATTRPETMLGDSAVAVHPTDERYTALVGQTVRLPLADRDIPIVADEYSDPEKGTGAVKITPAHDFNDFEVGKRHGLAQINILDAQGKLTGVVPEAYRGLDRFEARLRVVADMHALGLLAKIEPTTHTVPHGDRSGVVIEPWLTDQWYCNAGELAKEAIRAVEDGRTEFVPKNWEKTYFEWMHNIQPWCISRQLWWGHQIPAWYGPDGHVFVAATEADAMATAKSHYGKPTPLTRDPDVLDTWFSSALWPFSTLGWPEKTAEVKRYYPTALLVTGRDIIFFWVARMMMMGLAFKGEVPFRKVAIHGLVLDEKGQKMSKSKGNVEDPLGLIDEYGADALRFTMAALSTQGRDIRFSKQRVEGYRNFATKLWNASRFAEMNECVRRKGFDPAAIKEPLNRWIAGETERAVKSVTEALDAHRTNDAANAAYEFVWGTFCDWYLELVKSHLMGDDETIKDETRATVAWTLDQCLKLLHPFMPFITEELWAHMVEHGVARENLLCLSSWPTLEGLADPKVDAEVGFVVDLVSEVRSVRQEMNIPAGTKVPLVMVACDEHVRDRVARHEDTIARLARLDGITFAKTAPKESAVLVVGETTAAIPLKGLIDFETEKKRLEKEIAAAEGDIAKMDAKLENPNFMARAKPEAVEEAQARKAELQGQVKRLSAAMKRLG
ncbi:MAG: valine--tRNA ligase [Hyphomicrobiaceae bacterium]|nr:valine--tRNA ligase [Hyphomicrobiaceae bacterium]